MYYYKTKSDSKSLACSREFLGNPSESMLLTPSGPVPSEKAMMFPFNMLLYEQKDVVPLR